MDDGKPQHLAKLPMGFFHDAAAIWNAAMRGKRIPDQWRDMRTVLIPKADGGLRPAVNCTRYLEGV